MLGVLAKHIQDVSVLRRLLFAVVFLSPDLPMFWGVVLEFATAGKVSKSSNTPEQVRVLIENLQSFNAAAFETDDELQKRLIFLDAPGLKSIGLPLISQKSSCFVCGTVLVTFEASIKCRLSSSPFLQNYRSLSFNAPI